ncbi:MAG TPA: beta-propeller domain-containing protein, partial [Polyangiaceae bacterium]|nr:beta-propeller domain-containing protein [Polyangiaceae bacterium]
VALDTRDPSAITLSGKFEIPGNISDSRIVGDILYVAAYENGACWGCATVPRTNVMSLNVKNPASVSKVDQLSFEERTDSYSWKRSLTVTDRRMFVAGPRYGSEGPLGSVIQVIDISDPSGDMKEGANVEVFGQIDSRWQMDEYEGVLRVISQPLQWRSSDAPQVQTFTVESSQAIAPLASMELKLPRPEALQSVRFDGTRAYAITFERKDPLFTIDLADAAHPVQKGELEMPGFLYYMEPRGDRLIGLGYDQGNKDGALTVSIFDVADLAKPSMLSRVNFGGNWAWLAEDQDRIHKAFNVLDDAGLILVPFSGSYLEDSVDACSYRYQSGVQLIDWQSDSLALRGVAPAVGQARRGLIHDGRLLAMSDERVEMFDITNRDEPVTTATLRLAQNVQRSVPAGDNVVRIAQNWWTQNTELDVVPLTQASFPSDVPSLEIPELGGGKNSCYSSSWLGSANSSGKDVYLAYQTYEYDPAANQSYSRMNVVTVDASKPQSPKVSGRATLAEQFGYGWSSYGMVDTGAALVNIGSTLAFVDRQVRYDTGNTPFLERSNLVLADMTDPNQPATQSVAMPTGNGATGLIASGNVVATSHYEGVEGGARFYLDRVELTANGAKALPKINIPGSLVAYDAKTERAITVDYAQQVVPTITLKDCYERFAFPSFDIGQGTYTEDALGTCTAIIQSVNLIEIRDGKAHVLGRIVLKESERVGAVAQGDDRVFMTLGGAGYYYRLGVPSIGIADGASCFGCGTSFESGTLPLLTVSGLTSGQFVTGRIELESGDYYSGASIAAAGQRAVLATGFRGKLSVISAVDSAHPVLVREAEVPGYVQDLRVISNIAVASLGTDGVQTVDLAD